jgi:hypothetical protein
VLIGWLLGVHLTKHMKYSDTFLYCGAFLKKLDFVAVTVLATNCPGFTGFPVHVYSLTRGRSDVPGFGNLDVLYGQTLGGSVNFIVLGLVADSLEFHRTSSRD